MSVGGDASEKNEYEYTNRDAFDYRQSNESSFVDPSQQPFLDQLRQMAFGQYGNTAGGTADITAQANTTGQSAIANLLGLGNAENVISAQLEGLQSGLGEIHQQGLNTLGDNAMTAGAFGGSRHGVTEAALAGEIGDAFTRGYGDIMANASNQAIQANQGAIQGAGQNIANNITGNFGGLQALAGILGDPTILSQASSLGYGSDITRSERNSNASSAGFDFGYSK